MPVLKVTQPVPPVSTLIASIPPGIAAAVIVEFGVNRHIIIRTELRHVTIRNSIHVLPNVPI